MEKRRAYRKFIDNCGIDLTREKKTGKTDFTLVDYRRVCRRFYVTVIEQVVHGFDLHLSTEFCRSYPYLIKKFFFRQTAPVVVDGVVIPEMQHLGYQQLTYNHTLFKTILLKVPQKDPFRMLLNILLLSTISCVGGPYVYSDYEEGLVCLIGDSLTKNQVDVLTHVIFFNFECTNECIRFPLIKIILSEYKISSISGAIFAHYARLWDHFPKLYELFEYRMSKGDVSLISSYEIHKSRYVHDIFELGDIESSFEGSLYKEMWLMIQSIEGRFCNTPGYYDKGIIRKIISLVLNYYNTDNIGHIRR